MALFFKRLTFTALLLLCAAAGLAQKVTVEVGAPNVVAVGEMFRIEFSVNAKPDNPDKMAKQPAITGFDVLAGPTVSWGENINIVNNDVTRVVNYTYTYVLQAKTEGKFTIPPAELRVDGKNYASQPFTIEVVAEGAARPGGTAGQNGQNQGQGDPGQQQAQPAKSIGPDDILISASASSSNVFKGQPVKLILKLYTRLPLSGVHGAKLPAFNGFWSQELQMGNTPWQRETFNGKVYDAKIIGEYLLYPQQSGTLNIESFEMTAVAQIITQARRQSLLDDFFGGGPLVQEVQKQLKTRAISITVRDFPPGAPASFNGAVGEFSFDGKVSAPSVAANSAATYTLRISGSGNLPLIQAPKIEFPGSFEQYNIKTTESLSSTAAGTNGYRQFEYPFIARGEGVFTLDPVEFTYFNPGTARYVTLTVPAAELEVTPDAGGGSRQASGGIVSGLTKEDIKVLGSDIRFIKIGNPGFYASGFLLMGSAWYFGALLLIAALAVIAYYLSRSHIRHMGNLAAVKGKRANKMALGRFRAADRYRKENNRRQFYNEMLRALWGYMGDKLNIPAANLTKDNVREELAKRNVPSAQAERYIDVISACEQAQYSPETTGQMDELYRAGVESISGMESILK